jgi:hypothetical protein
MSTYLHTCAVNFSAAPFPNAIRSTASVLDLLSGSRTAYPEDGSLDACAEHVIAVPSSRKEMSQEDKATSAQLLKDEDFASSQISSQCYEGKRLAAYYMFGTD